MVDFYSARLKSDIFKASHHGRDTGYHQKALGLISPDLTIVSVGVKPDTDASNKYRHQTGDRVPFTRYHGNIEVINWQSRSRLKPLAALARDGRWSLSAC